MIDRFARDSRGVSELLAFVLTFGIIMLAVGLAYVGGFGALTDQQEAEQVRAADLGMTALEGTIDSIERGEANSRTGELRLAGGSLTAGESATVSVSVDHDDGTWSEEVTTGSLTYQSGNSVVTYENGAIIRRDGDSGMVQKSPAIHCTADSAVVSLVEIKQRGDSSSVSSDGSVEVGIEKRGNRFYYPVTEDGTTFDADAANSVSLSIESSEHADEWEMWLDDQEEWTPTGDGYECDTDAVFVRTTVIDVRLFT